MIHIHRRHLYPASHSTERYWKLKAIQAFHFPRKGLQGRPFLDYPGLPVVLLHPTENPEIVERKQLGNDSAKRIAGTPLQTQRKLPY